MRQDSDVHSQKMGSLCARYLQAIAAVFDGDMTLWKKNGEYRWLQYLWATKENDFNRARFTEQAKVAGREPLAYVRRTLRHLTGKQGQCAPELMDIAAEALAWAEASKGGMPREREAWRKNGISLVDHAVGSSRLYLSSQGRGNRPLRAVALLIQMHGALGQYIQGEVAPDGQTLPLTSEPGRNRLREACAGLEISFEKFCRCLALVSECVLAGVKESLVAENQALLDLVAQGELLPYYDVTERLKRLCGCRELWGAPLSDKARALLTHTDIWYADGTFKALKAAGAVQFLKALAESAEIPSAKEAALPLACSPMISLKGIQENLYFYANGKRRTDYCMLAMLERAVSGGLLGQTEHIRLSVEGPSGGEQKVLAEFTHTGSAIDGFYRALVVSDITHNKAVLLVFDQLGYRSDIFDRVGNEDDYLEHMNRAADDKQKLLRFLRDGQRVLDVGPGGGVLLELIQKKYPRCSLAGADISTEVCERLRRKAEANGYGWTVLHTDFLALNGESTGRFDAIVFCSILHEIFSYSVYEGRRFNKAVIGQMLKKAAALLTDGGRIMIRDGIAADSVQEVSILFRDYELEALAKDYIGQFRGFPLAARGPEATGQAHLYRMPYNSMMEMLYTITWGKESLPFEVEEWYGYFSRKDWERLAGELRADGLELIYYTQYLQPGYIAHLKDKVVLTGEDGGPLAFPDSNAIIVFEKGRG